MQMEPTEGYEVIGYVPAKTLVYNQPATCYTLVALSEEDPTAGKQFALLCFPDAPQIKHTVLLAPTHSTLHPSQIFIACVGAALSDAEHDFSLLFGGCQASLLLSWFPCAVALLSQAMRAGR